MNNNEKIVDFKKYCETCEYKERDPELIPCTYCLDCPVNTNSKKPVHYKECQQKEKNKKVNKR